MPKHKKDKKKKAANYMQYAGLAFQMGLIFFLGIYFGKKLDVYFGNETPGFTIFLIVFLFIGFMYKLYKDLS